MGIAKAAGIFYDGKEGICMIIVLKPEAERQRVEELIGGIESMGLSCHCSTGTQMTIVGIIGDTSKVDVDAVRANDIVEDVKRVSEPYKAANRKFHPEDTVVAAGEARIGGGFFSVIAGPCSVESQGLQGQGLELLLEAKKATGLPVVTELMSLHHLDLFAEVDVIQVGARNMQNFEMLKELGHCGKPILLKRGLANTLEEFLMSAEYILAGGNAQVVLCERGIRTFETMTRNTLDISAIPLLHHQSHLPVVVDPSHAAGIPWLVEPLSKAAIAAGADGLMIEVHNNPKAALCDGAQSLTPAQFDGVMDKIKRQLAFEGKTIQ